MHALKPQGVRIPRVFRNHKGPDGRIYRAYVLPILARLFADKRDGARTRLERIGCVVARFHLDRVHARRG